VLLKRDQFSEYLRHLLDCLCRPENNSNPFTIHQATQHPFRPKDVPIPGQTEHVSYFLVSLPNPEETYIGETGDLKRRLNAHNTGNGSQSTNRPHLRPWALLGYVVGFESRETRRQFEYQWQLHVQNTQIATHQSLSAMQKLYLATEIISSWNSKEQLSFIVCGNI
jgi:predicted GIY-YIG superfamily endonuclease